MGQKQPASAGKRSRHLQLSQEQPGDNGLPDTDATHFAAKAHRQSQAIATSPQEREDQAFIDAISWFNHQLEIDTRLVTMRSDLHCG